jgi:gamma-glutamyltranspeptidase / glutathione hydrolase / leukotriene-C4 hydrolase
MRLMRLLRLHSASELSTCSRKHALSAFIVFLTKVLFSSGIGGGGFMTVRVPVESGSEVWTIDFRETAPALASSTMYINDPSASRVGGLAAGVPGELRGLEEAHRRWGSLDWKRLVTPSVELAKGWPVGKELSNRLKVCL